MGWWEGYWIPNGLLWGHRLGCTLCITWVSYIICSQPEEKNIQGKTEREKAGPERTSVKTNKGIIMINGVCRKKYTKVKECMWGVEKKNWRLLLLALISLSANQQQEWMTKLISSSLNLTRAPLFTLSLLWFTQPVRIFPTASFLLVNPSWLQWLEPVKYNFYPLYFPCYSRLVISKKKRWANGWSNSGNSFRPRSCLNILLPRVLKLYAH